jgi:hypothetical protein
VIDDMALLYMSPLTQSAYVRAVKNFGLFFWRSPDKLTFEDVRANQLHPVSRGLQAQTINQVICALRFFEVTHTGGQDAASACPSRRCAARRSSRRRRSPAS